MPIQKLVDLFFNQEQKTINLLRKEKTKITKTISSIKKKIRNKSRIIYIGSGTSGRLGILDAVECKPTFSTNIFKGVIAGGKGAVFQAKEGAEDNTEASIKDLKKIKITKQDVVIGISASGETPYTLSAIRFAKKCKALTIGITSNPKSTLSRITHENISPEIRDEIILGSSRLSSGTAQKILLNMISSILMIKSNKIFGNLMIDVQPTNKKLVKRAIRIISIICNISVNKAKKIFLKAKKNTKAAIVMHFKKCDLETAKKTLQKTNYNLRKIIS